MSNKIFGYIKVSKEQNTDRQKQALLEYGVDEEIFKKGTVNSKLIGWFRDGSVRE